MYYSTWKVIAFPIYSRFKIYVFIEKLFIYNQQENKKSKNMEFCKFMKLFKWRTFSRNFVIKKKWLNTFYFHICCFFYCSISVL